MSRVFIIAEAGVNHNGNLEMALQLVDQAAAVGADAIKFQTFKADNVVVRGTEKAEYQKQFTSASDQHEMIRALELDEEAHSIIAKRCQEKQIEFMSTPFDDWGVDLLLRLGMKRIKIASGELTNRPFIEMVARTGAPLILSTGMATLAEVKRSVDWIQAQRRHEEDKSWLTILHCTSNYPTDPEDVNLRAMRTLVHEIQFPVGYSDHTLGIEISLAAVAMGATVIEKHFTLDRSLPGPDHQASLSPDDLEAMVRGIRNIERAFGSGEKKPTDSEYPVRSLVRRSAFARFNLKAGEALSSENTVFLRPGTGIGPEHWNELQGRRIQRSLRQGDLLRWDDLA